MTEPIVWTPDTVAVGELVPWGENPRRSTKAEARRIIESREKFGEAKPLLIGPNNELYDGHQNTSALLAVKGKKHLVKVWRSNRELTTTERQELVLALHQGATGGWDLEALGNWDLGMLVANGFDTDALDQTRQEMAFLIEMLGEGEGNEAEGEFGTSPEEQKEMYDSGEYGRQIVLLYSMDDYKDVINMLESYVKANGIETYSDAVVNLLKEAGE